MNEAVRLIVQALMTVALLIFAYIMEARTPGVSNMIVGAAVALWLRESGQQAANSLRRPRRKS